MLNKSKLLLFCTISCFLICWASPSAVYAQNFFTHEFVKTILQSQLGKAWQKEITIQSVTGPLFGRVDLHGVVIRDLPGQDNGINIQIKDIAIEFDFTKTLLAKGDIIPNIKVVRLNEPKLNVQRVRGRKWNLEYFFPAPVPGVKSTAPTFIGTIQIQQATGAFNDEQGWGKESLIESFRAQLNSWSGEVSFISPTYLTFALHGDINRNQTVAKVDLTGRQNLISNAFSVKAKLNDLDADSWVTYGFNSKVVQLHNGRLDLQVQAESPNINKEPLSFVLDIMLKKLDLQLAMLGTPMSQVQGKIRVWPDHALIEQLTGQIESSRFSYSGTISSFSRGSINGVLRSNNLDSKAVALLLPKIPLNGVEGTGKLELEIKQTMSDPLVVGMISDYKGKVAMLPINGGICSFTWSKDRLVYQIHEAWSMEGKIQSKGSITLGPKNYLSSEWRLQKITLPPAFKLGKGQISVNGLVRGSLDNLEADLSWNGSNCQIAGQTLVKADTIFHIAWPLVKLEDSFCWLNDKRITIGGSWDMAKRNYALKVGATYVSLNKYNYQGITYGGGHCNLWIDLQGGLSKTQLISSMQGNVTMNLEDSYLAGKAVDSLDLAFSADGDELSVQRFAIQTGEQKLGYDGKWSNAGPRKGNLTAVNFKLDEIKLLKYQGILNANVNFNEIEEPLDANKYVLKQLLPLRLFQAQGSFALRQGMLAEQPIDNLNCRFEWDGRKMLLSRLDLSVHESKLSLDGAVGADGNLELDVLPATALNLDDFSALTYRYGRFAGNGSFSGQIRGNIRAPMITMTIGASKIYVNNFSLNELNLSFKYRNNKLDFQPLEINQGVDHYLLRGEIGLTENWLAQLRGQTDRGKLVNNYSLLVSVENGHLQQMVTIIDDLTAELKRANIIQKRFVLGEQVSTENISIVSLSSPAPIIRQNKQVLFNASRYDESEPLRYWSNIQQLLDNAHNPQSYELKKLFSGECEGEMILDSSTGIEGSVRFADLQMNALKAKNAELVFSSPAEDFKIYVRLDNGSLGAARLDEMFARFTYSPEGWLMVNQFDLAVNGQRHGDVMQGKIPLAALWKPEMADEEIDLMCVFHEDSLGIFTVMTKMIADIKHSGSAILTVKGPLRNARIDSQYLDLKNMRIQLGPEAIAKSPLVIEQAECFIKSNRIYLKNCDVSWRGEETNQQSNRFQLNGVLDLGVLNLASLKEFSCEANLSVADTNLELNLEDLFVGHLKMRGVKITDRLVIPLSQESIDRLEEKFAKQQEEALSVVGNIDLINGKIIYPPLRPPKRKAPLKFDFNLYLGQDIDITGGLLGSGGLLTFLVNNIELKVDDHTDLLKAQGSLNFPRVTGKIQIKEGRMTLLNKDFQLLNREEQRGYFLTDITKQRENAVYFETGKLDYDSAQLQVQGKIVPYLQLVAKLDVETQVTVTNNGIATTEKDNKSILALLNGSVANISSMVFEEYNMNGVKPVLARMPIKLEKDTTPDKIDYLINLLSPGDYYSRVFEDFQQNGLNSQLVAEFSEKQVNALFKSALRPVERQLARSVGLYDLRLDYNLGKNVNQILSLQDDQTQSDATSADGEKIVGLELVSNLMADRLFITLKPEVRRLQEGSSPSLKLAEWMLTYYVQDWLTLNFANKQFNPQDPIRGILSLEASHAF